MKRSVRLALKRETLTQLTGDQLGALAGGQALTDACVFDTDVCATVGQCVSDGCTYHCFYTLTCR